jgi:hypothetical protein
VIQGLDIPPIAIPRDECALAEDEYNDLLASTSTEAQKAAAAREWTALQSSYLPFRVGQFFDRHPPFLAGTPICLIHAHSNVTFQTLFDMGVKAGNATEDQREEFWKLLETWKGDMLVNQSQFLRLTERENGKAMMAREGTGHDVMMLDVDVCVQAVKWVLERVALGKRT